MSLYPSDPVPSYGMQIISRWKTLQSQFDMGRPQRRQKRVQALYDVVMAYNVLTLVQMRALWTFYQERCGALESFFIYTLETDVWSRVYVGIGDDSTVIFDIPGSSTSGHLVYLNGALLNSELYSISAGGGEENADRITFTLPPGINTIIECAFTGYLQIKCHFKEDNLTREQFYYQLYKTGLELEGLPR